ncbi:MAG: alpha/beta hydrolase [Fimbriimonadaceae bacterium]
MSCVLSGMIMSLLILSLSPNFDVREVSFPSADGTVIHADFYKKDGSGRNMAVLFHQMGSSGKEYETIAAKLLEMGYDCLAPDMRGGGNLFGSHRNIGDASLPAPERAELGYQDMQATMKWVKANEPRKQMIVWGSSYSAGLVFPLVVGEQNVSALLSFSPTTPSFNKRMVFDGIDIPIFITMPQNEEASRAEMMKMLKFPNVTHFKQHGGVHGSSTVIESKNSTGAKENWDAVVKFLNSLDSIK